MGHPPPNHEVGKVMASLQLHNARQGTFEHNLVVLDVILLLDVEKFLVREDNFFVPVLSVQLEKTLSPCPSNLLQSSCKVSL
jgi:hypothetical protein